MHVAAGTSMALALLSAVAVNLASSSRSAEPDLVFFRTWAVGICGGWLIGTALLLFVST